MTAAGKHQECLQLAKEALDCLQKREKGDVSRAIRKLQLCANLLNDEDLKKWCAFHLGEYDYRLPRPPKDTTNASSKEYIIKLKSEIDKLGINVTAEELVSKLNNGDSPKSIEFIENKFEQLIKDKRQNDGKYYRNDLLDSICISANAATKQAIKLYSAFAFGDIPSRQFDIIRERVDNILLDICPDAVEKFMSAYELLGSKSSEDWSLALTACRRVIKAVADALFPPQNSERHGRKMGEDQYINRLWAFLDDHMEAGSDKDLAKAHINYLGSFIQRLNEKASKGVHATVGYEEAVRVVLYTYLTLGDILEFASTSVEQTLSNKGKTDLNSASFEELCKIPGINSAVAKGIISRRAKNEFNSVQQLNEISGVGSKTMEKVKPYLIALPKNRDKMV